MGRIDPQDLTPCQRARGRANSENPDRRNRYRYRQKIFFTETGLDNRGAIVLKCKLSRSQLEYRLANTTPLPDRHGGLCWLSPFEPQT